jgi:gliding motility-associated-like protein
MRTYLRSLLTCLCAFLLSEAKALPLNPPPPNDLQCNAHDLGILDFVPCMLGDSIFVQGATEWASYDYGTTHSNYCLTNGSPDVWYKFKTQSTFVSIELQSTTLGFDSIFVRIFNAETNNCVNLIPLECISTLNGTLITEFYTPEFNGEYYLEIGGNDWDEVGTFDLVIKGREACNNCTKDVKIELFPPPVNAHYYPGDNVVMCVEIDRYNTLGVSSIHSIVPILIGGEWNANSLTPLQAPTSLNNPIGWTWTTSMTPNGNRPGYFYDGDNNGDPSDNLGDAGQILQTWEACWSATVNQNFSGNDLYAKVFIYSDDQTGSASTNSCGPDPSIKLDLQVYPCDPPILTFLLPTNCSNLVWSLGVSPTSLTDTIDYYLVDASNQTVDSLINHVGTVFPFVLAEPGTYTLASYNQTTGCLTFVSTTLLYPLVAQVSQTAIGCGSGTGEATASVTFGTPPYNFLWLQTGTIGPVDTLLDDGWQTVLITDSSGCSRLDSVFITSLPTAQADFDYPSTVFCDDQQIAQDLFPLTQGGLYTLIAPLSVPEIAVDQFSGIINLSSVPNNILPTWVVVEYTVGTAPCADSYRDSIWVEATPPTPVPDNQSQNLTWCNPAAVPVLQIIAVAGQNPVWFDDLGNIVALGTNYTPPFTSNTPAGTYTYYVLFTPNIVSTTCYGLPAVYNVVVLNGFTITASADTIICPGEPVQIQINGCPTCAYTWLPQTGLDNAFSSTPVATVNQTTFYAVTATDQNSGCEAYELVTISTDTALCDDSTNIVLEIFNGITPNGDNINDSWIISGIENASNVRVTIYNRWGGVVWNVIGYNNSDIVFRGFDQNGNMLADGTYYYLITTGVMTRRGWLEITR